MKKSQNLSVEALLSSVAGREVLKTTQRLSLISGIIKNSMGIMVKALVLYITAT